MIAAANPRFGRRPFAGGAHHSRGKGSAAWREIAGRRIFFRSRWEANYARYLQWLKERGDIVEWEHEAHTFWFDKIRRGVTSCKPDFRVTENGGTQVFHEVKGWMDDKSRIALKRMAKYFPEVKIIVVDQKAYAKIRGQLLTLVPGWEP